MSSYRTKFLWLNKGRDQEDAGIIPVFSDRIPSVIEVTKFDLFCFLFAITTYVFDIFSDFGAAYFHFRYGRIVEGSFILAFSLIPSLSINIISFIWMCDDERQEKSKANPRRSVTVGLDEKTFLSKPVKCILCLFQLGPLFWYYKAFYFGYIFRNKANNAAEKRKCFSKMVEAERDATLLRFFEAYLESAPQLIVQGTILARFFWNGPSIVPFWIYYQTCSLMSSIISISWSLIVHNRSLRMVRDDKINLWPREVILQFIWRFGTVLSRIIILNLFIVFFPPVIVVIFLMMHILISGFHIFYLQALHMEECTRLEMFLLLINVAIHIFTPFNMAETPTRFRYLFAYLLELTELILFHCFMPVIAYSFPFIYEIKIGTISSFLTGILAMWLYYYFLHPNYREPGAPPPELDNLDGNQIEDDTKRDAVSVETV